MTKYMVFSFETEEYPPEKLVRVLLPAVHQVLADELQFLVDLDRLDHVGLLRLSERAGQDADSTRGESYVQALLNGVLYYYIVLSTVLLHSTSVELVIDIRHSNT